MTSYLLIIFGESIFENQHLDFNKVLKELSSWDEVSSNVNVNTELDTFLSSNPTLNDDNFHYESEKLTLDIVFNPKLKAALAFIQEFCICAGAYRQLVFEGTFLKHNGSWILQDGLLTYEMLEDMFKSIEINEAIKSSKVMGKIMIGASAEGDWNKINFSKISAAISQQNKLEIILTNPINESIEPLPCWKNFHQLLKSNYPSFLTNSELLPTSDVIGSVRFNNPTAYIFPGGGGDSCLFGVSGFTMLIDGGFSKKPCFWDFVCYLDRVDALVVTRFSPDNLLGLSSLAKRMRGVMEEDARTNFHPQFGSFFANVPPKLTHSTASEIENGSTTSLPLLNIYNEANSIIHDFNKAGLNARPCLAVKQGSVIQPTNLYHKVGHGSLDIYFLNPLSDSKHLKELMTQWPKRGNAYKSPLPPSVPLFDSASVAMAIVWRPTGINKTATRILFSSCLPQNLFFEALDRVKMVDIFKSPVYCENIKVSTVIKKPEVSGVKNPSGTKTPTKLNEKEEMLKVDEESADLVTGEKINGAMSTEALSIDCETNKKSPTTKKKKVPTATLR